jgi:hypothetical protein
MSGWTAAWLAVLAAFGVIEYLAVKRKVPGDDNDTLSEQVWWLRNNVPGGFFILVAFLSWLVVHFLFGG